MPKPSPISPGASWTCQWMTPVCKTFICSLAQCELLLGLIPALRCSLYLITVLNCFSRTFYHFSLICFFWTQFPLLSSGLWLKFLEKSSRECVCSFHCHICALGEGGGNINKRLRAKTEQAISSLSCVATIKTSLMIHNHVIFYFTLSKDGTLPKCLYCLALFTRVIVVDQSRVEEGNWNWGNWNSCHPRPLKSDCFESSHWICSQNV